MERGTLEQDTVTSSHHQEIFWMSANPPATEISDERLQQVLRKFEDAKETSMHTIFNFFSYIINYVPE